MKLKINLLIIFSTIILVVLAAMQYYLVKTAYDYKVEEFRTEIQNKIAKVTNEDNDIDSSIFYKKNLLYKEMVAQYIKDSRKGFKIEDTVQQGEFRDVLSGRLQQELKHEFPELKLDFAVVLNKFVMYDGSVPDTLFAQEPRIENAIMGSLTSLDDAFMVRNYVGTVAGSSNGLGNDHSLLTEDTLYIYIHDWQQVIYSRMLLIFLFSAFVMITLITLFVIAIRALIKQKKVSDIKTDFINNITHELKTPLTTLSVSTKILQRKETINDPELFNNIVDTISRQNIRLQNLIDQVLVNSLGYDEIELSKENIEITALLQTVCNDFTMAHPNIDFKTDFNKTAIKLVLDTFYLTTAITNVLENAVKYGCKSITLKTVLQYGFFTISIQDDGIGIAKDKQLLLFDKFYRVAQGNIHNAKGLGLGLYYTNQIVKAHQGYINVISQLGKGAMFNITIPAV
ncbi:histidine kinase [Flavobacterium rivuli WB 3.3-2 = DSM 21788]|uniref:histidine kinase n=1 Tax=Flavobacterium rivuli WB 3.3-2 = DSM 21788 TaxID=1121895 RepID=A0A0A2M7U5_9FLAO|nr:HAMP domain-containing sensor histidine kinase [Flavobacterium rivuli]KGO88354.1 histidine kinase [Flavobacterium rivuli WB 3.3-2 = DSM 21788]